MDFLQDEIAAAAADAKTAGQPGKYLLALTNSQLQQPLLQKPEKSERPEKKLFKASVGTRVEKRKTNYLETLWNSILKLMSTGHLSNGHQELAVHYETKQPIPQALVDKIKKQRSPSIKGYMTTELISAAALDMDCICNQ
ncbi:hypothetical protein FQA39_LY19382 [Lamprigera yunnana]|nr:hypothetical protein FQA39_LY19382 [Lamprigera yunnana]